MQSTEATVAAALAKHLGSDRATAMLHACKLELGMRRISTPRDMLRIADALIKLGGVPAGIGRALKVRAILDEG